MKKDIVVKVENISKKYCKSLKKIMLYGAIDIIKDFFCINTGSYKLREDEFWAVQNISFSPEEEENLLG